MINAALAAAVAAPFLVWAWREMRKIERQVDAHVERINVDRERYRR